jgi:hypothetical protein
LRGVDVGTELSLHPSLQRELLGAFALIRFFVGLIFLWIIRVRLLGFLPGIVLLTHGLLAALLLLLTTLLMLLAALLLMLLLLPHRLATLVLFLGHISGFSRIPRGALVRLFLMTRVLMFRVVRRIFAKFVFLIH